MAENAWVVVVCLVGLAASPSPATAYQDRWESEENPAVVVGGAEERGAPLYGAWAATRMPNGHLVILNGGTDELFVFDPEGGLVRRVGREGEGPGEFQGARSLGQDGNGGLWVYDPVSIRVTRFDDAWEVTETRRIGYELSEVTPMSGWVGPLANGNVVLENGATSMFDSHSRPEGLHVDSMLVRIHDGDRVREIGRYERGRVFKVREGTSGLSPLVPFGPWTFVASGMDVVAVGSSHHRTVSVLDPQRDVVRTVQGEGELRAVTRQDWESFRARFLEGRRDAMTIRGIRVDRMSLAERFLHETARGDQLPLYDEIRIDRRGNVWLREFTFEDMADWQVIGESGVVRARLSLPREWTLLDQGPSHVVVRVEDDLGVQEVRLYRTR